MPALTLSHALDIRHLDSEVEDLSTKELEALVEIRIGYVPNSVQLVSFLSRCPNVGTLWWGETSQHPRVDQIPANCLPLLRKFTGPLEIAKLLIPGRPLEDVSAFTSAFRKPLDVTIITKLMTAGTFPLRHLHIGIVVWREGCLDEIATLCCQLESLVVFVRELPKVILFHLPHVSVFLLISVHNKGVASG